jgi:hypothetical protein
MIASVALVVHLAFVGSSLPLLQEEADPKERLLATLDGVEIENCVFRSTGEGYAARVRDGDRKWVIVNGSKHGPHEDVRGPYGFTPTGDVVYSAKRDTKWFVMVGKEKGPAWDEIPSLVHTDKTGRVVHAASRDGKWSVVIGGEPAEAFDHVGQPIVSVDGESIAYPAVRGNQMFMVVGTKKFGPFDRVDSPIFGSDNKTVAFVAYNRSTNRYFPVLRDKKGEEFDAIGPLSLRPDGELTFGAKSGEKNLLATGNRKVEYPHRIWRAVSNPRSAEVAYVGIEGRNWFLVYRGKTRGEFEALGVPQFSPDGAHICCVGIRDGKHVLVIDDQISEAFDEIATPRFAENSRSLGFGARKGAEIWWKVIGIR